MKRAFVFAALAPVLLLSACKKEEASSAAGQWSSKAMAGKDLYATINTNRGAITVKLFSKDAPKTVTNFVGLATGERDWKNPATGEMKKGIALYNGTTFHRVMPGFMIQGGDPLGTGAGNPGYNFEDEFQSGRTFDRVGLLAMANGGPGTNGSQFFITTGTPKHLNNKHTIFGEVVKGYEVVEAISRVPTMPVNRPVEPVIMSSISISETVQ